MPADQGGEIQSNEKSPDTDGLQCGRVLADSSSVKPNSLCHWQFGASTSARFRSHQTDPQILVKVSRRDL